MILEPKDGREIMVSQCCVLTKLKDCFVQNPIEHCSSGNCQFLECHSFFCNDNLKCQIIIVDVFQLATTLREHSNYVRIWARVCS
jgi:hypothetical protein